MYSNPLGGAKPTPSRPLNPAEQMAKDVLDMRAAGRAGEVTDEMMAQADPQYMYFNTPLPMDEASRMARGDTLFPTDAYHSTRSDFTEFGKGDVGYHVGTEEQATERLRGTRGEFGAEGEAIIPLRHSVNNPLQTADAGDWNDARRAGQVLSRGGLPDASSIREDAVDIAESFMDNSDWLASQENTDLLDDLRRSLQSEGYDSVKYHNEVENAYGSTPGMTREAKSKYNVLNKEWHELRKAEALRAAKENPLPDPSTATSADIEAWLNSKIEPVDNPVENRMAEIRMQMDDIQRTGASDPTSTIILDPANVRSRFALFDPEFKHLRNLSAGVGGMGLLGMSYPQEGQY